MPGGGGAGQKHPDLSVLDPARGPGVLPLHPDGVNALLHVAGLVHDQDRVGDPQVLHDDRADVVTDGVGVPHRLAQQVLHPFRAGITGVLGDRPAVLAGQIR